MASNVELQQDDIALADKMNEGRKAILAELHKRIIGQHHVMELVLQTLFVGGNSLIIGVPRLYTAMFVGISGRVSARGSLAAKSFRALLWLSTTLRRHPGYKAT